MRFASRTHISFVPYVAALRPHQWTKNLIVFAAPLFSFSLTGDVLAGSLLAFMLFCCASSSFYLFNDIADVKEDRLHPVKCKRPIAAGLVPVPAALAIALLLLTIALGVGFWRSPLLGLTLLLYACLQVAYNLKLKRIVILDVIVIAAGFVLRSYAGAVAGNIALSSWFVLCTAMLALFLGIEKRKAELRLLSSGRGKTRAVLQRYSLPLLSRMEGVVVAGSIMSYTLWSFGPTLKGASTSWMMLTLPFVLYGIFRYQLLSDPSEWERQAGTSRKGGQTERPEEVLLHDLPILGTVVGWLLTVFVILLLKHQGIIS